MEAETQLEAKLRTLKLESYEAEKALLDKAELGLKRLYAQKYETIDGKRVKLTKRAKIAKAKTFLESLFSGEADVRADAMAMLKALDQ